VKIGTSPITNKIYAGNTRKDKTGLELWTKKEDITEQAIKAVFEHMYQLAKETGKSQYIIDGFGKMTLEKDE
jgi:hypothetical protein